MSDRPQFKQAFPYQDTILALPVTDLDAASGWYSDHFGMTEVERTGGEEPAVILERDGTRIGFGITGKNPADAGAAILVAGIHGLRDEFEAKGLEAGNWRVDKRDDKSFQVFFIVAPDGLCYYFHEPVEADG